MNEKNFNETITKILGGKKYRGLDLPRETIAALLESELARKEKKSLAVKAVKAKLHNIVAPYLDTLDYALASENLKAAIEEKSAAAIEVVCREILRAHDSTRERLPYLIDFYAHIFDKIGSGCTILDLACGMNPFFIPLVKTPANFHYKAYDIHAPRIALINQLFSGLDIKGKAFKQDILINPPEEKATTAFLFKEAHRIEKRESGASRKLVSAVNAEHIFISLPTHNLNGKFNLRERMRRLVDGITEDIGVLEDSTTFASEIVFYIRKKTDG